MTDFNSVLNRMKIATQAKTQTSLATILQVGKAAISDAKRRNIIPADWYLKLSRPPYRLNPLWLETGHGLMQIPQDSALEACARAPVFSDSQAPSNTLFEVVPFANTTPSPLGASLDLDTTRENQYAFARAWLEKNGSLPHLKLLRVSGDSMRPALHDNDIVLIDEAQKDIRDGKIYAIRIDSNLVVKRVAKKPGALVLISDNRELYDPFDIDLHLGPSLEIIGRVVWMAREAL